MTKLCKCGHKKGDHESWSESTWVGAYLGTNYSHCKKCGSVEKGNLWHFNCRYFRPINCVCQKLVGSHKMRSKGFDYHKDDLICKCADKCVAKEETDDWVDGVGRVHKQDGDGTYDHRDGLGICTLKKCRCEE